MLHDMLGTGEWVDERGVNLLDGGGPFYATYRCAPMAVTSRSARGLRVYQLLLDGLGLADDPACTSPTSNAPTGLQSVLACKRHSPRGHATSGLPSKVIEAGRSSPAAARR